MSCMRLNASRPSLQWRAQGRETYNFGKVSFFAASKLSQSLQCRSVSTRWLIHCVFNALHLFTVARASKGISLPSLRGYLCSGRNYYLFTCCHVGSAWRNVWTTAFAAPAAKCAEVPWPDFCA